MGKVSKIFKREFFSRIKKKSFIVMTILGPLLLASLLVIPQLIDKYERSREKVVAIIDDTNLLGQTIQNFESYTFIPVKNATVDDISRDFASSGFDAVLFIPNNIYSSNSVILYSNVWVDEALKAYVGYALRRDLEYMALLHENVAAETIGKVSTPVFVGVQKWNEKGETIENESTMESKMLVSTVLTLVIYMFVLMYGILVLRGIQEEKSSRIVEIILSSVKPVKFITGKILGIGCAGFVQFLVWVILTFGIIEAAQVILFPEPYVPTQLPEMAETLGQNIAGSTSIQMPDSSSMAYAIDLFQTVNNVNWFVVIISFIVFFILGYFLYAAVFAVIGAISDYDTDSQQFIIPVTTPLFLPVMLLPIIVSNPNGSLAFWLSQIPFTSPIAMIARLPFGISYVDMIMSIVILLISSICILLLSSKLYNSGAILSPRMVKKKVK